MIDKMELHIYAHVLPIMFLIIKKRYFCMPAPGMTFLWCNNARKNSAYSQSYCTLFTRTNWNQ